MARASISKKRRFDLFKRDKFTCQYCGRTPPAVVLEIDHINPVAKGGSGEDHNLITSCFDCNRGKSDGTLEGVPLNTQEKSELLAERIEQAKAYDKLLRKQKANQDKQVDTIIDLYRRKFPGWTLKDSTRPSIKRFLSELPLIEVEEAMEMACARVDENHAFRYFCGVCWRKIKGDAR